jgi:mRNA interferase RelE/StbE
MIFYEKSVQKNYQKGEIPKRIMILFHNAFLSLDLTKDLNLFDIKKIKGNYSRDYFRLRKGKYRAIFYILNNDYYIIYIGKRKEVYNKWQ